MRMLKWSRLLGSSPLMEGAVQSRQRTIDETFGVAGPSTREAEVDEENNNLDKLDVTEPVGSLGTILQITKVM